MSTNKTTPLPSTSQIYFRLQCTSTTFSEWINLLTLCLAPLITHVVFGFADPVLLSSSPHQHPRWTDRLAQFSPITIIWRWLAIVNRRIRIGRAWDRRDMAATNAIFWTGRDNDCDSRGGWDGSEETMARSRAWISKLPEASHVSWLSGSTLATIAMSLQGVAAVWRMTRTQNTDWQTDTWALPDIYAPIAVLSLTRLPASVWLSAEYGFDAEKYWGGREKQQQRRVRVIGGKEQQRQQQRGNYHALPQQQQQQQQHDEANPTRLGPKTPLHHLWTLFSLLITLSGCSLGAYLSISGTGPRPFVLIASASSLTMMLYYLLLNVAGGLIMTYYLLRGRGGETAIPCMNAAWYKLLNGLIMTAAVAMFVVTALETKVVDDGGGGEGGRAVTYRVPPPAV